MLPKGTDPYSPFRVRTNAISTKSPLAEGAASTAAAGTVTIGCPPLSPQPISPAPAWGPLCFTQRTLELIEAHLRQAVKDLIDLNG